MKRITLVLRSAYTFILAGLLTVACDPITGIYKSVEDGGPNATVEYASIIQNTPVEVIVCPPRDELMLWLRGTMGEVSRYVGIDHSNGVIEILVAPDDSTWTVVINLPGGTSCMIASGSHWMTIPVEKEDLKKLPSY